MFGRGATTQCTEGRCGIGTVFRIRQVYRRRSMLPSHLHDVMGSANLSLARGDSEAAVKLCNEVIRQGTCNLVLHWGVRCIHYRKWVCSEAPHVVKPFLTLATVYEDRGETEKLVQVT